MDDYGALVGSAQDEIIAVARRMLRIASFSGQEKPLADLIQCEMERLAYDRVWVDGAGNVIGLLRGAGGSSVMLHAHMDIVGVGDEREWSHAPFAADRADGYLWGRGSCDDKGCLAAQLFAVGLLKRGGLTPPGDVYVAAVVHEEDGGFGTRHLVGHLRPDVAVIGEPSGCELRRGHRGRFEWVVDFFGRSVHASVPDRGLNPLFSLSRFLLKLRNAPMHSESVFGGSTVAPTLTYVDQSSSNVIPAKATVHLDWRTAPGETLEEARQKLLCLLREAAEPGISTNLRVHTHTVRAYTGLEMLIDRALPGYCLDESDPWLCQAQGALAESLQRQVPVGVWQFCTDGGHMAAVGIPCVGYGPGKETMAHVLDERLSVAQLLEAVHGYMALAVSLGAAG